MKNTLASLMAFVAMAALVGCAGSAESRQRTCDIAPAVVAAYQAAIATGVEVSPQQAAAAAAAQAMVTALCFTPTETPVAGLQSGDVIVVHRFIDPKGDIETKFNRLLDRLDREALTYMETKRGAVLLQ